MDSYDILNVSRDASDKEIEVSYNDLKRKYDPTFNTSINAYKKYREIIKAYENIRDENRRKLYNLKEDYLLKDEEEKEYKLYDFNLEKKEEKITIDYEAVEDISKTIKEDIIIDLKLSYLYYLLNLNYEINYKKRVKCNECKEFEACPTCEGVGVVYYKEKQVYCPMCQGEGKVSSNCSICGSEGYYNKEEKLSFSVDKDVIEFKGLGNEYYDNSKSNLVINLNFFDKDNIKVHDDFIEVNYYLSKNETLNGVYKEYYSDNGIFKIEIPSFVDDGYQKEIIFNSKKIIFTFYNNKLDGEDIVYYLIVNKKYKNSILYFSKDYKECSKQENDIYCNKLNIKDELVIDSFGEKGKYNGSNGNLIIKTIFLDKDILIYSENVEVLNTSGVFNFLGGTFNNFKHYGFKRKNALIKKDDKYYYLNGEDKTKSKLKNYFLFKIVSILLWLMIPIILLFMRYSETMFITLISVLLGYCVVINLLMEVEV